MDNLQGRSGIYNFSLIVSAIYFKLWFSKYLLTCYTSYLVLGSLEEHNDVKNHWHVILVFDGEGFSFPSLIMYHSQITITSCSQVSKFLNPNPRPFFRAHFFIPQIHMKCARGKSTKKFQEFRRRVRFED